MSKRKHRSHRHAFRFRVGSGTVTLWAKVVPAKRDVYLPLRAEHVAESIKLRGVGNTQTCAMAVCAARNAECFPHKVEGYIDWFYSRAFVVSKLDKNGMPIECYEYMHSDKIAQLNDTKGGQHKLLDQLRERGDRIIHLRPVRDRASQKGSGAPKGIGNGSRTRIAAKGAKLRFAVAQMGGVAA